MGIQSITLLKRGKSYFADVDTFGKKPTHQEIHNFLMTGTKYLDSPRHGKLHITKNK